jgi:hypothetical protein
MECTDLRRKEMDDGEEGPLLQSAKAGCCLEWEEDTTDHGPWTRGWGLMHQYDVLAPFARLVINEIGQPLQDGGA